MDKSRVVVARNDVSKGGELFFNSLDDNFVWKSVPDGKKLLICRCSGHNDTTAVSDGQTAHNLCCADRAAHKRDTLAKDGVDLLSKGGDVCKSVNIQLI